MNKRYRRYNADIMQRNYALRERRLWRLQNDNKPIMPAGRLMVAGRVVGRTCTITGLRFTPVQWADIEAAEKYQ